MNFVFVFVFQLVGRDQARLQQAGDEGARAGEGVKDMHALTPKGLAELRLQHVIHRMDDEIHHLNRGVDDAKAGSQQGEGGAEELVDSDQPAGDGGADKFVKMPPPSTPSKGRTVEHNAYAITRHAARWKIANSCQITTVLFCPYVEIEGQGLVS